MVDSQLAKTMLPELIDCLPGAVYRLKYENGAFRFLYISEGIQALCGVSPQRAMDDIDSIFSLIHPEDYPRVIEESMDTAEHGVVWHGEFRMCLNDGRTRWMAAYDRPEYLADGSILWTGYIHDNTEHKVLVQALRASEEKFRAYVEAANDIIYSVAADGALTYVSPNWTDMLGHPVDEVVGKTIAEFVHPDDLSACLAFLARIYHSGTKQSGIEYRVRHRDGHWCWHTSNASPLFDEQGEVVSYVGIARDITERKAMEEQIQHMAHYDALTELPNRALFSDRLEQAMRRAERDRNEIAVLFVDLDRFKPVNDRYGHAVGDLLLQQVAQRMGHCLRASDTVARIGGDEFVVLLPEVEGEEGVSHLATKLLQSVSRPYRINGIELQISCSIGAALYPEHGETQLELMRAADTAMYRAKDQQGNRMTIAP
ncbi:MAG TPA: diguanylate cyclase [Gammaproteobacteria bacterium]